MQFPYKEYYGTSAEKEISPQDEDNEEEMENEKVKKLF